MRKVILILLALGCSLLSAAECNTVRVSCAALPVSVLTVAQADINQWQCEREYNSDLGLLRVNYSAPAAVQVPVPFRADHSVTGRVMLPCGGHGKYLLKRTSEFESFDLFAGPHAVDFYVYRLRRLLI